MNYGESSHRERWLFTAAQLVSTSHMAVTAVHRQVEGKLRYWAELAVGHPERSPCEKHIDYQQGEWPFRRFSVSARGCYALCFLGQS